MTVDALTLDPPLCVPPPPLTEEQIIAAAVEATLIHPPNAPPEGALGALASALEGPPTPLRIALVTNLYWGPQTRILSVSFMEQTSPTLANKILSHMNSWKCGITFSQTNGVGDVRISRGSGGYYSYLGVGIRSVPQNQQTMNLERFTLDTPDSEFYRVIRHETGHTLGFPHEHMRKSLVDRVDPQKAYAYFRQTQGWSRSEVDQQVLTPLDERSIMSTPADQTSVMCYQLPGSITVDGKPILGGTDINHTDAAFALARYPLAIVPTPTPTPTTPTPTTGDGTITFCLPDTTTTGGVVTLYGRPYVASLTQSSKIKLTPR